MMGHLSVYESYVDDIISDHQHDCMWGGHCYVCLAKSGFSAEVKEEDEEVVVDASGALSHQHQHHYQHQHQHPHPHQHQHQYQHGYGTVGQAGRVELLSPEPQLLVQQLLQVPAAPPAPQSPPTIILHHATSNLHSTSRQARPCSPQLCATPQQQVVTQQSAASTATATATATATPIGRPHKNKTTVSGGDGPKSKSKFYARKKGGGQKQGHQPTPDTKKLRHREVEKNRHRLLQAMVKTLSERIPGRLDKETQVQTMKRAARYCVFLREIANEMSRVGSPVSGSALKGKLDKIYHVARDNVELLMSKK